MKPVLLALTLLAPTPSFATLILELEVPTSCLEKFSVQTPDSESLDALFQRLVLPSFESLAQDDEVLNALFSYELQRLGSAPGKLPPQPEDLAPHQQRIWESYQKVIDAANAHSDGVITIEVPNREVWVGKADQFAALPEVRGLQISGQYVKAYSLSGRQKEIREAREVEGKMRALLDRSRVMVSNASQAGYMKQIVSKWRVGVKAHLEKVEDELQSIAALDAHQKHLQLTPELKQKLGEPLVSQIEPLLNSGSKSDMAFQYEFSSSSYNSKKGAFNNVEFLKRIETMADHQNISTNIQYFSIINIKEQRIRLQDKQEIYESSIDQLNLLLKDLDRALLIFSLP